MGTGWVTICVNFLCILQSRLPPSTSCHSSNVSGHQLSMPTYSVLSVLTVVLFLILCRQAACLLRLFTVVTSVKMMNFTLTCNPLWVWRQIAWLVLLCKQVGQVNIACCSTVAEVSISYEGNGAKATFRKMVRNTLEVLPTTQLLALWLKYT